MSKIVAADFSLRETTSYQPDLVLYRFQAVLSECSNPKGLGNLLGVRIQDREASITPGSEGPDLPAQTPMGLGRDL